MKYFYDTEFHEDGKTIDFISIGIVAEDGREFYGVSSEFDTRRVASHDWLMKNVMSSIEHEQFIVHDFEGKLAVRDIYVTDKAKMTRAEIAQGIVSLVGADREAQFHAWYSSYDHVCLAQLFGRMIDLPDMIPMYTADIRSLVDQARLKPGDLPKQPSGHHNALDDARHNVVRYNYLIGILSK